MHRRRLYSSNFWEVFNPTKIYFGEDYLTPLHQELKKYGKKVLLVYGGGSIKKNGVYDAVMKVLMEEGKDVAEVSCVLPNPKLDKLYEGIKIAREHQTDFILAVGGGSVFDYCKALAVSIHCEDDPWEKYFIRFEEPTCQIVPLGGILIMVGTGSEMNAGSVITNSKTKQKIGHVFASEEVMPRFSILNPVFTYSLPHYQMVAGIYDIFNHICEQYFSGKDDNVSDYIAEGLMRSLLVSSRIANKNPEDYEARSNIMWTATWALNTLISKGKSTDWEVHMLGQAVGGYTNAIHVFDVDPKSGSDTEIAWEGLNRMEAWMKELGLVMNLSDLGVTPDMIEGIADVTFVMNGGYKILDRNEIVAILKDSL